MSQMGQERRISAVRNLSALPPRADVGADIVEPPLSATTCREQTQQPECVEGDLLDHLIGELLEMQRHLLCFAFPLPFRGRRAPSC
jgi:hypothetical protein